MAHQSGQSHRHTKSTNILRKNPLPISLFIQYSFQIQFPPACEYNRFSKKWGETAVFAGSVRRKDDKVSNKTWCRKKGNGKKESKKEGLNEFATKNIILLESTRGKNEALIHIQSN